MRKSQWGISAITWILFLCIVVIGILSCRNQIYDWPRYIMSNLWVSGGAERVHYYRLAESYQVAYELRECYPGREFIQNMVNKMVNNGWRRLDNDILNPNIKANYIKAAGGLWDRYTDKDSGVIYQWIDDWEDSKKNCIRYGLKYRGKYDTPEKNCNLEVVVIFLPVNALQSDKDKKK